ncbi:uncharacterized protein LOC109199398 [Oreochromis niloticus]|uniref:uncharacterized protein LOC109199398 n=1 Tax=Oreochromis niloticus TaxID=8128 RepID=UPI000DF3FE88|nr:uncharacterized protein LOC109199398 [Oreochromis niloticus]
MTNMEECDESVEECKEFFLQQTPQNIPEILEGGEILDKNRYKLICQTFENTRTFVTLYDTHNKSPVFSAAKAVNTDYDHYNQQKFDRGRLFPNSYACDLTEKISTFTLTNAVPQKSHFNRGKWNQMEKCVKRFLDENCINNKKMEGFVVIGAKPSDSASSDSSLLNNKINIPSVLWSAFCCYSSSQKKWLAGAHWGENRDDHHKYLETKTLGALYTTLGIEAFPGTRGPEDLTTQVY